MPGFTLQDRLRKAREYAGLDQQQLADRMGVSRGTVGNAEHGKVKVRAITIRAWALACGVDATWLEHGTTPPPRPPFREPLTFGSEGWEFESLRARMVTAAA